MEALQLGRRENCQLHVQRSKLMTAYSRSRRADIVKGCGRPVPVEYEINPTRSHKATDVKFAFVCDPKYDDEGVGADQTIPRRPYPALNVVRKEEILTGPHYTHDLGWEIPGHILPQGQGRCSISGKKIKQLAAGIRDGLMTDEPVPFLVSWLRIDGDGRPDRVVRGSTCDKKWRGNFKTDPGSTCLCIEDVEQLPFWCGRCEEEITGMAQVCRDCQDFALCPLCYPQRRDEEDHETGHDRFRGVDLDV